MRYQRRQNTVKRRDAISSDKQQLCLIDLVYIADLAAIEIRLTGEGKLSHGQK
jgi:hypothetical protein